MNLTVAELVAIDREHLIHPLHHPLDNACPIVYIRGCGATVQDVAAGLHALGAAPADVGAVFEALRASGAIRAVVVIR